VSPYFWLTAQPTLGCSLFLLKTGFWPSFCQISTDLDKILHTADLEFIAEKPFQNSRVTRRNCECLAVLNDARRQYILLVHTVVTKRSNECLSLAKFDFCVYEI